MSSVVDYLTDIVESITSIPSLIINGIKDIFVPDTEVIKQQFNNMISDVKTSFNLDLSIFDSFGNLSEEPLVDTKADYTISGVGTFNLTFLDSSFIKDAVEFFRPLIRAFLVFLLCLYNYKQILSFIGQDPNIANHAYENYKNSKGGE